MAEHGKLTEKHLDEALRDDNYANLPKNLADDAAKLDKKTGNKKE